MKAMLLAAGLGQRLAPITQHTPKPLVKLAGKPLIGHQIEALAAAGIKEIVINLYHLGEQIRTELGDGQRYGVQLHYSPETVLLGVAGGIVQALPLLGTDPFLVVSSDIWTAYPYHRLLQPPKKLAHMVFAPNPNFHLKGDYYLADNDLVTDTPPFSHATRYTYASFGTFHPDFFADLEPGIHHDIAQLIARQVALGTITGELYTGRWFNIGSIEELEKARAVPA